MTDTNPLEPAAPEIKHKSRGIPTVWLVPLVAAAVGGWLALEHFREAGIPIELTFETASGIEAGKTKIKYKGFQVGVVDSVGIAQDLKTVRLGVTMARGTRPHLLEETQFWVVQPRVGPGGISGLSTIISGAYINMRVGGGKATRTFTGLEEPPVAAANVEGVRVVLEAEELGSLRPGVPVFFRDVQVGEVEKTRLEDDGSGVEMDVLVEAPYDRFVRTSSHFWNASGVEVSVGSEGLMLRTEGLVSLLAGGLAFDSPIEGEPAKDGAVFHLHASFSEATQHPHPERGPFFVLYPPGPTRGLEVGADVALEGIVIGEVTDVKMEYAPEFGIRTPVQIRLEPANVHGVHPGDAKEVSGMIADLVERGLRAQLKSESFLTGRLYVDLGFHPEVPVQLVGGGDLPELPTAPSTVQSLEQKAEQFLDHLAAMPLEGLITDAQATVEALRGLVLKVDEKVDPLVEGVDGVSAEARMTLGALRDVALKVDGKLGPLVEGVDGVTAEARKTLAAATAAIAVIDGSAAGFAPGSALYYDLATALEELSAAARSIRVLTAYLERHPNALITGKSKSGGQ